jgi:hypothetical protein
LGKSRKIIILIFSLLNNACIYAQSNFEDSLSKKIEHGLTFFKDLRESYITAIKFEKSSNIISSLDEPRNSIDSSIINFFNSAQIRNYILTNAQKSFVIPISIYILDENQNLKFNSIILNLSNITAFLRQLSDIGNDNNFKIFKPVALIIYKGKATTKNNK